jgi:hypothetical protein
MQTGGNKRAKDFFASQPVQEYGLNKYGSTYASDYKAELVSEVKNVLGYIYNSIVC